MVLRLAGLAALALLSSACTHRLQTTAVDATYAEPAQGLYDESFGRSPSRPAPIETARGLDDDNATRHDAAPVRDNALGVSVAPSGPAVEDEVGEGAALEATDAEYEEVEATPGTACYDAAVKAGITSGTCTLVKERTYLLVGEKAR